MKTKRALFLISQEDGMAREAIVEFQGAITNGFCVWSCFVIAIDGQHIPRPAKISTKVWPATLELSPAEQESYGERILRSAFHGIGKPIVDFLRLQ
jgi:hypothetical protein